MKTIAVAVVVVAGMVAAANVAQAGSQTIPGVVVVTN